MGGVFDWIVLHGPAALFLLLLLGVVGLPIPDETLLVFCGYLISKGRMQAAETFLAGVAGTWCGISLSYTIGRTFGLGVVHRFGKYLHITEERLGKVHVWFDRIGHWALFVGYFIAGVRHFTAIVAGISRLRFRSFAMYAWSGGVLWVASFLTLGYFLGERWKEVAELVHKYVLEASVVLILASAGVYYVRVRNARKSNNNRAGMAR
jgi:membrane protein DedA with SNARE-associated domain